MDFTSITYGLDSCRLRRRRRDSGQDDPPSPGGRHPTTAVRAPEPRHLGAAAGPATCECHASVPEGNLDRDTRREARAPELCHVAPPQHPQLYRTAQASRKVILTAARKLLGREHRSHAPRRNRSARNMRTVQASHKGNLDHGTNLTCVGGASVPNGNPDRRPQT